MSLELAPHAVTITPEQIELVKKTVALGATADELRLYFYDCQRRGVHPLDRMIHFTKRGGRYTPITGIDFLRSRAAETKEHGGTDATIFSDGAAADQHPASATVTIYRIVQGQRCAFTATARWEEYCPREDKEAFMWRKMPTTMLSKCAEALALRKAFPQELAGLYVTEEMDQATPARGHQSQVPTTEATISPTPPGPSADRRITDKQIGRLHAIRQRCQVSEESLHAYLAGLGIEHVDEILMAQYDTVIAWLESGRTGA